MSTVSVIIPTYNRCSTLQRSLGSVLNQSRPPEQVIVVDDGSYDGSADLIHTRFPQVDYLYQENSGVSAARNRGIAAARGEWIALLDSDDAWLPDKLARQMTALAQQPDYHICHTEEVWIRNGKRVNAMRKHAKSGGWIFQRCLPLCVISPSSVIIHRSVFEQVGVFDESLPACEDYDLWLRICARYPVLFLETPLIEKYGGHEDQLSRKFIGMDRFRVQALKSILDSGVLSAEDTEHARRQLLEKAAIYMHGARKHGRHDEAKRMQQLCAQVV